MAPLAAYVARLRRPGVTEARVLFLMEKPGPQAAPSGAGEDAGFISRDNNGETTKALRRFLLEAGLPRRDTAIWNVIPWWNGSIAVTAAERAAGLRELPHALALLPRLHTAVLVGRTAARARPVLQGLRILESAHPSPQVRAGNRALWDAIPAGAAVKELRRQALRGTCASSAGTNSSVVSSVQPRLSSSRSPMLAVPGCCDSASEPKAVAVVRAENSTARAVAEPRGCARPARQFMTK